MAGPDFAIQDPLVYFPVIIENNGSLSAAQPLKGYTLVGIQMPAAWTAAAITLQACVTADGTYGDVVDAEGTEIEIAADADQFILLDPVKMAPLANVKIRSGTTDNPVPQEAERILTLVGRII